MSDALVTLASLIWDHAVLDLVLLLFLYHVASLGSLSAAPSPAVATALLVLLSAGFVVVGTAHALPSIAAVAAGWETSRCARFYVTAALQAAGGAALLSQGTRAHGAALLCAVSVGVWPSLLQLTQLGALGTLRVVHQAPLIWACAAIARHPERAASLALGGRAAAADDCACCKAEAACDEEAPLIVKTE